MSLTNCRFYEEKYPEIESFVMVNVKQVTNRSHTLMVAWLILADS
jgi:translation initiation factor 2 alpha subunit (eIF-2alpha)